MGSTGLGPTFRASDDELAGRLRKSLPCGPFHFAPFCLSLLTRVTLNPFPPPHTVRYFEDTAESEVAKATRKGEWLK